MVLTLKDTLVENKQRHVNVVDYTIILVAAAAFCCCRVRVLATLGSVLARAQASATMQRALLLLSTLCTASVAFRFAPPRISSLSAKPNNIGLASPSCQTHVGLRTRVAAGGWQARAVGNRPRRTIFGSSGGDIQEDKAST